MLRHTMGFGLACLLVIALPAIAGPAGHGRVMTADDAETFDLSDLADGETRYFGSGDGEFQATREGDRVVVRFDGEEPSREITCTIGQERCLVLTPDAGAGTLILRSDGDEDSRTISVVRADASGSAVFVGSGEAGGGTMTVHIDGEDPMRWVDADGGATTIVEVGRSDTVVLRCPEGDTTMTLEKGEDAGPYYCPRHQLELERVPRDPSREPHGFVVVVEDPSDPR
ncbi:MAG: hypothetical protein PVF68_06880 [Acidobacteriota bacterium]|jgi:hypothetical protein